MEEFLKKTSAKPAWSALKRKIKTWETPKLLGLVKDLFELSADNRDFLAARLLSDKTNTGIDVSRIAPYKKRIESALFEKAGWPRDKFNLSDARKAIRDYRKATSDTVGTLFLMIYYVETGTAFCKDFGEGMSLVDSISSLMTEIQTACSGKRRGKELYCQFRQRLLRLRKRSRGISYGYGDHVADIIEGLEIQWSNEE